MKPGLRIESLFKTGSAHMAVAERRMRQIFNLFDHGNPKKALQAIEKLLQKLPSPQPPFLLTLKCLASFRTGRRAEAHKASTKLLQSQELLKDSNAVAVLAEYFRESNQIVQLENLYQALADSEQTEENLCLLFYAQLMTGNCERQRHTTNKLYKLTGKSLYNMWSICCMIEQAKSLPEGDHERDVLLRLCARIADTLENLFFQVAVAEVAKDYGKIQELLDRETIELSRWKKREQEFLQQSCMHTIIVTCDDPIRLLLLLRNRFTWFAVNWSHMMTLSNRLVALLKPDLLRDCIDWLDPLRLPPVHRDETNIWKGDDIEAVVAKLVEECCQAGNSPVVAQNHLAKLEIPMDKARPVPAYDSKAIYQVDTASLLAIYISSRVDARFCFFEVKRYLRNYGVYRPCRFDLHAVMDIQSAYLRRLLAVYLYNDLVEEFKWPLVFNDTRAQTMVVNTLSVVNWLSGNVLNGGCRMTKDHERRLRSLNFYHLFDSAECCRRRTLPTSGLSYVYVEDVIGGSTGNRPVDGRSRSDNVEDVIGCLTSNQPVDARNQTGNLLNGDVGKRGGPVDDKDVKTVDYYSCPLDELKPPTYWYLCEDSLAFVRFASALAARCYQRGDSGDLSLPDVLQMMCVGAVRTYDVFFECVCMLEDQLARHPVHPYANLLLMRLYSMCGAYECVDEHFRKLNVKNIQSYSLAHLIVNDAMRLGCWNQGLIALETLGRAMSANREETAASLVELLQSERINCEHAMTHELSELVRSFPRQVEFVSCRLNFVCAWLLMKDELLDCDLPGMDADDLCDNRDFKPLAAFCSIDHDLERQRAESLRDTQLMAALRRSIIRLLAGYQDGTISTAAETNDDDQRFCIHGPSPTGWRTVRFLDLATLVEQHSKLPADHDRCAARVSRLYMLLKQIVAALDQSHPCHIGLLIETLALTVEFSSYSLLFMKRATLPANSPLKQQWRNLLGYAKKLCNEKARKAQGLCLPANGKFYRFQRSAEITIKKIADAHCTCFMALRSIVELRMAIIEQL